MRASTFVWIAAAAVPRLVKADGGGDNWYTTTCWETETTWQMKTMWATTTCWSTYETTITDYITDTTTETDTDYITKYSTLTSIVSVPYTVPVTITDISTVVSVSTKNVPVPTTIVSYATEVETTTIVEITSIPYGVTNTATQINTQISQITSVQVQTVEKTVTVFVTVQGPTISVPYTIVQTPPSAPPTPTSTLTGLVPCPSRVTNPTYTASTPIPTEWTWGCPPGTLCKPKQVDCNFEVDLPADGYICSPDECVVPPPLPSPSDLDSWIDYSCNTLFTPSPGYFNIVPTSFGYGGDSIFAFGGQTAVPCTSQPVTQISDGQPQAPTGPAVTQISDGQPQAATGAPITQISDGQPQATVTARAVLEERAAGLVPRNCYSLCDNAGYDAQATGKIYSGLCLPPNPFQEHLSACNACIAKQSPVPPYTAVTPLLPSMGQWIAFCTNEAKARGAPTSSTPASQLAPPSSSAAPHASTSASAPVSASASPTSLSSASATPPPPTSTAAAPPAGTTSSSLISQLTQISDGQPQAPTSPSSFTGAASSIIRAQDSWWITLLSFLITLF